MSRNPRKLQVMVDLETLGKKPGCKIGSIGAVVMNIRGRGLFYQAIRRAQQGTLTEDDGTLKWWAELNRTKGVAYPWADAQALTLHTVLLMFAKWLNELSELYGAEIVIWGNGSMFDNAILGEAYELADIKKPWQFWNDACYRTVKGLVPLVEMTRTGTHHHALDDAVSQADHLQSILEHLQLWGLEGTPFEVLRPLEKVKEQVESGGRRMADVLVSQAARQRMPWYQRVLLWLKGY